MKDVAMVKKFFMEITDDVNKDGVEKAWGNVGLVNVARMDTTILAQIKEIFDNNGVNYMKPTNVPYFFLFDYRLDQLTPEVINMLQLCYGKKETRTINR